MALRMKSSKFRHVFGAQCRREQTFENVRITRNTHDSNFCAVNPKSLAVVTESSGGGAFVILDVNRPGRVDVNCPRVCGHEGAILDIKWNPFDDCVIASGSDDATVKIWTVPETGLQGTLTDWSADLHGHSRRVAYIDWHTTAANVLMSVGFDFKIMIWNVEQAEPITSLDCHQDTIFSVSWGHDGSLIASTCKDRQIRILDPRTAKVAMKSNGHQSAKASKISFVTENQVFTTGFSRISDRQYALWDIRKSGAPLMIEDLDSSSGILLPYYDPDTKVIYLAGKGDGNIRYFEIEDGSVQFLNTYQSSLPQRGFGMMPKRGVDPYKNEVARFYKLHASKNLVEPVSMIVPRKAEGFQPDVFPPTASAIPSLTADEWTSGVNRGPILVDLQTGAIMDKPRSSMSPAVTSQIPALSKPPQITTCKAISRAPPTSLNAAPTSYCPAPYVTQASPSSQRTSPEGHDQVVLGSPSQMARTLSANQIIASFNGRDKSNLAPASIRNIKCLSMSGEDSDQQPQSQLSSQEPTISPGQGRDSRSPGSPLNFVSQPTASPTRGHHHNGFGGNVSADEHNAITHGSPHYPPPSVSPHYPPPSVSPHFPLPSVSPHFPPPSVSPNATVQGHTHLLPPPQATFPFTNQFSPGGGSNASAAAQRSVSHVPGYTHDSGDLPPWLSPAGGGTGTVTVGTVNVPEVAYSNAIHVRKVWAPYVEATMPSVTSPLQARVTSPGTDLELKKAYFRQLDEIRSLQEQLERKDTKIKQLEARLVQFKDIEIGLQPGESNL